MSGGIVIIGLLTAVVTGAMLLFRAVRPRPRVYASDGAEWASRRSGRAPRNMGGQAPADTRAERWPRRRHRRRGLRVMVALTAAGVASTITRYAGHTSPHIPGTYVVIFLISLWIGWSMFGRR
jgi:hypothetical protein